MIDGNELVESLTLDNPAAFRMRLINAFPPQHFHGLVSKHDECDEGIALRQTLPGMRWDELPSEFIDFNSGSLPLLEPQSLIAFLPAYLYRSVQTLKQESVLAEFTLYFLCPGNEEDGWDEKCIAERVSLFTAEQRNCITEFLQSISETAQHRNNSSWTIQALKWWRPTDHLAPSAVDNLPD